MTTAQFKALPPLCRRADLLEMGLTDEVLEAVRYEIKAADDEVPARRIGYLRLPTSRAQGNGKGFYRTRDALKLLGREFL